MAILTTTDAATLRTIIANNENWLIDRILLHARQQGYNRYAPSLRESWRQSIHKLSATVLATLEKGIDELDLRPEVDDTVDPLARFGIIEANRHMKRGISPAVFLGLMKYCRQSYMDLIENEAPDRKRRRQFCQVMQRIFDRIEISLCTAWQTPPENDRFACLQQANRAMSNEKNKYLTIFESLHSPAAVLDRENEIDISNHAWKVLFGGTMKPGSDCDSHGRSPQATWLTKEIDRFIAEGKDEAVMEKQVTTEHGKRHLSIRIKRMLDVSGKFSGCVVILDDVTVRKQAEEATRNSERLHGALELAGAVCHDLNQPLMAISGYAELILMDCPENAPEVSKLEKIINQVNKLGDITKKLMHVTRYETKTYMDRQIIDIEKASGGS